MKLSNNKEIKNTTLIVILIISGLFFSFLGFDFIGVVFSLFLVIGVIYLCCPKTKSLAKPQIDSLKNSNHIIEDRVEKISLESTLTDEQKKHLMARWDKFGRLDAVCPSCGINLVKFPKRKIKCKSCKKNINRGKNYFSGDYLLYDDKNEKLYVELLWLSNGTWKNWFESFDEIEKFKEKLAEAYKYKGNVENIPLNDAIWGKIQKKLVELSSQGDWNGYKWLLESGIRFLNDENNTAAALPLIYQFIYLSYIVDHSYESEYDSLVLFPKQMSTGGVSLLMTMVEDTPDFDEKYLNFIKTTALPSIFKKDIMESLNQYKIQSGAFVKEYNERMQRETKL
ncbi:MULTISPECIES: hypothetical protein [Legionellaceae]|uniref:hypothetical protein n=1 Tax=Legionellaceae TaxID=444 RepID=UPI0007306062|nr:MULTISPECIES: hypothetical protein [Legionellaceae]CZO83002.1 Uncharacterised protein [Legionella pneumophila]